MSNNTDWRKEAGRKGAMALNSDPEKKHAATVKAAQKRKAENPNVFKEMGAHGGKNAGHRVYKGKRTKDGCIVTVQKKWQERELPLYTRYVNHSPTGFEWGYGGSGPGQLAFAILFDYFNRDKEQAFKYYMDFKWKVIAEIKEPEWQLTNEDIAKTINDIDNERDKPNDK